MGTVLEMRARRIAAVLALALLGACSGGDGADGGAVAAEGDAGGASGSASGAGGTPLTAAVSRIQSFYVGDEQFAAVGTDPSLFTPEAIAASPASFRLVQINALGLVEPARVVQDNGAEDTYRLKSGPTAAFDDGVLVATRGFGDDLHAFGSQGVLPALRAGGGQVTRLMEMIDAQDQVVTARFDCTIAPAGTEAVDLGLRQESLRRFDENCRGEALIFDNIYWLDGAGAVVASRQYVSPSVAYLRANRL
jgi:hypothetical protein